MKPVCPHCRSTRITVSKNGTVIRCRTCLYSWKVAPA